LCARIATLRVEPAADAALRESLESSGLLLLGERHGVAENPLLARALLEHFDLSGLALEWEFAMRPALEAFFYDGELAELAQHPLFWCGDGRITAGHLALLRTLARREDFELALFSGPSPPGWSARDAAMSKRLIPQLRTSTLVVAGNLHTRLESHARGIPLGAHLARARPGLRSIEIHYLGGGYFNLGERAFRAPCAERPSARLFLAATGQATLELTCATPADVPHQPPSGQRR
jgi:hypothetical protein